LTVTNLCGFPQSICKSRAGHGSLKQLERGNGNCAGAFNAFSNAAEGEVARSKSGDRSAMVSSDCSLLLLFYDEKAYITAFGNEYRTYKFVIAVAAIPSDFFAQSPVFI
jgi:hypothetical protein